MLERIAGMARPAPLNATQPQELPTVSAHQFAVAFVAVQQHLDLPCGQTGVISNGALNSV
jgi:hypothetical protein